HKSLSTTSRMQKDLSVPCFRAVATVHATFPPPAVGRLGASTCPLAGDRSDLDVRPASQTPPPPDHLAPPPDARRRHRGSGGHGWRRRPSHDLVSRGGPSQRTTGRPSRGDPRATGRRSIEGGPKRIRIRGRWGTRRAAGGNRGSRPAGPRPGVAGRQGPLPFGRRLVARGDRRLL